MTTNEKGKLCYIIASQKRNAPQYILESSLPPIAHSSTGHFYLSCCNSTVRDLVRKCQVEEVSFKIET